MSAAPKEPPRDPTPLRALPSPRMARPDSYAPEAEQAILAALCENNALVEHCGALRYHPEWFSLPHRDLAEVELSMIARGEHADYISIVDEARRRKMEVGDDDRIADLSESLSRLDVIPSSVAVRTWAQQVMRAAKERLIFAWTEKATGLSLAGSEDELERSMIERRELLAQFGDVNEKPRFAFMTDTEVENLPAPEWLIPGYLVKNTISVLYGEYGSAKSFLATDWALSLGTGQPWLGHMTERAVVAYIAGEGIGGMGKRIKAWKAHHKWSGPSDLHLLGEPPQLLQDNDIAALLSALHALPESPVMVVIDTLARSLVGGDENSAQDMGIAVANAEIIRREFNCHVLIVHHTPWDAKRPRGSSALPGATYTNIAVAKEENAVTVHCAKQKDFDTFADLSLMLHVVALDDYADETSCVLVEGATIPSQRRTERARIPQSEQLIATYLDEVTHATFAEICATLHLRARITDRAIRYAVDRMLGDGTIETDQGVYRLVAHSE